MILALLVALLLGVLSGTLTGLAPGIHINLISAIIVSSLTFLSVFPPIILVIFIVAMSITHTFIDFIPSIYLGAPEEDSFLSILPGHKLLLEGLGHQAFVMTLYGSLTAIPLILILSPLFLFFLSPIFNFTKIFIPFILLFISLFIILREKSILPSLIVFSLSGFLGYFTFQLPVDQPLLPLLSGLFGLSTLFFSLKSKSVIPHQKLQNIREIKLPKKELFKSIFSTFLISPLFSFLPGI